MASLIAALSFVLAPVAAANDLAGDGGPRAETEGGDGGDSTEGGGDSPEADDDPKADAQKVLAAVEVTDRRLGPTGAELTHKSAAAATVIDIDHGAIPPSASVADVLDEVAGVDVRRLGGPGDPAFVRIRGSSAQQVEVFVDGVPLNAHGGAAVDLSELDLDAFDRVEVYRGLAPAELDAAPIGGVVHLRTRPGLALPPRVKVTFGSWRTRSVFAEGGHAATLPTGAQGDLRLSVGYDGTKGDYRYFSHNGTLYNLRDDRVRERANNHKDQLDATAVASVRHGPLRLSLRDRILWRASGVPGNTNARTFSSSLEVADNLLAGRAEIDPRAGVQILGDLSWRFRWEKYEDREGEIGVGAEATRDRYQQPAAGLSVVFRPTSWLRVLPSTRLVIDSYTPVSALGSPDTDGPRVRLASSWKVAADIALWGDRITIEPQASFHVLDNRALGTVPYTDSPHTSASDQVQVAGSPGLALAVRPWDWLTVRASALAFAFRAPTFDELFGDRGAIAGRAGLRPEKAHTIDGGVRLRSPASDRIRAGLELGGFVVDTRDTITWGVNSQGVATPGNLGRTFVSGAEAAAHVDLSRHLSVSGSATYTWSTVLEGPRGTLNHQLPNVPRWQAHATVAAFWDPWIRVAWRFDYSSGSFDSVSNFFEQAPRPLHSISARVQPGRPWPWVAVEVTNVADHIVAVQFRDPLHPKEDDRTVVAVQDFRGNPLPGRAVFVSVGWTHHEPTRGDAPPRSDQEKTR
jgi:outer membrane receptor protein involved in Fe transport